MFETQILARASARGAALAAMVGVLAACGGGGANGDGGSGQTVDGKDRSAVANQAMVTVELLAQLDDMSAAPVAPSASGGTVATAQAKAASDLCTGGGSASDASSTTQPGDVPFAEAQALNYSISTTSFQDCVVDEDTQTFEDPDGAGPATGGTITYRAVLNGTERDGSASDAGNNYGFAAFGSSSAPLRFALQTRTVQNGQTIDMTLNLDSFLRSDARASDSRTESQTYASFQFGVQGQTQGQSGGVSGEIRIGAGLDQRFQVIETAQGETLTGQYRLDLDHVCQATVDVATVSPIIRDGAGEPSGGELRLTVNGTTSTVSYASDGSVSVTRDGVTQTFSAEDLALSQQGAACNAAAFAPFALGSSVN